MNIRYTAIIFTLLLLLLMCGTASAWLPEYDHRIEISVNNTGDVLTYYQYNFTMDTATEIAAGNMTYSDGRDCRITDVSDNLLPFWNETPFDRSNTKIWVNATSLGNTTNTTHYLYYGNAVSMVTNGSTTFNFFDSFKYGGTEWYGEWNTDVLSGTNGWMIHANVSDNAKEDIVTITGGRYRTYNQDTGAEIANVSIFNVANCPRGLKNADINNNGYDEIMFLESDASTAHLWVIDKDGSEMWNKSYSVSSLSEISYISVGELNTSNSGLEIVVSSPSTAWEYDYNGNEMWNRSITLTGDAESIITSMIADFDNDTKGEVFIGGSGGHNTYLLNGEDGTDAWSNPVSVMGDSDSANYADCDRDGVPDIIVVSSKRTGTSGIQVLNGLNGTELWRDDSYTDHCDECCVYTNPVSGLPEIWIGSIKYNNKLYYHNGTVKWQTSVDSGEWKFEIFAGNLTGDSAIEVGWASFGDGSVPKYLRCFNTTGELIATESLDARKRVLYYDEKVFTMDTYTGSNLTATSLHMITGSGSLSDKWTITGSPTTGDGIVNLTADDKIVGKTSFSSGHAIISNSIATEQDTDFVGFVNSTEADYLKIQSNDGATRCADNNFDCLCWFSRKAPDYDGDCVDSLLDFRGASYNYEITWMSDKVGYLQNNTELHNYTGANISTDNMFPYLQVWDSSAASTLTVEWVLIRKYVTTEPIASVGLVEDALSVGNNIVLGTNKYGLLRKDVTTAQTFSTIASGFAHDVCFTWWDDVTDTWKSYWVGDTYNSAQSIPEHESYFVLMDGTGETVSCGVAPAETVVIPTGWSSIYLRESTSHTLTEIKTGMQVDGTVTNLYAWNHGTSGTGAWVSVDVTPTFVVEPNEGMLINNGGAQYNWDGSI